ncbi:hypothetical protein ACIQNU_00530 [Streptomyces sp. NPDC091292]|uniref:hypothetical protein n=1 Tax=Streptomyces sp. NPDC091292 TaxID=3365991 RepID=UPI0037FB44F8
MAAGGFCKLPNGSVVVALNLPSPIPGAVSVTVPGPTGGPANAAPLPYPGLPCAGRVRVLVHAANRARALTRLRNLGLRSVYLRGNAEPPTPDEITAVLHHPDGLLWRTAPDNRAELWHPIRALLSP